MSRTYRQRAQTEAFDHHPSARMRQALARETAGDRPGAPLDWRALPPTAQRLLQALRRADRHRWGHPPAVTRRQAHHRQRQADRQALHRWWHQDKEPFLDHHRHGLQRLWDQY